MRSGATRGYSRRGVVWYVRGSLFFLIANGRWGCPVVDCRASRACAPLRVGMIKHKNCSQFKDREGLFLKQTTAELR